MLKNIFALALALLPLACGGGGGPANPTALCSQSESIVCDKMFSCVPVSAQDATFIAAFGSSVAECKAKISADCAGTTCNGPYNASAAQTCVNDIAAFTCAQILDPALQEPAACTTACP